jgi:hypothetical protein
MNRLFLMFKLIPNHRLNANIGLSIISGITALSLAGVAMQMGYSNFKIKAEKQLHILNSIRFSTIVQIGIEEGWVIAPNTDESLIITLSDIEDNYPLSSNLKNPSQASQNYDLESSVTILNADGKLNFYCTLIEDQTNHTYTDSTVVVSNLTIENITLPLE